jgi:photosystem II stability/assembly factor-like uncharacterized protein/PKD repeat protein
MKNFFLSLMAITVLAACNTKTESKFFEKRKGRVPLRDRMDLAWAQEKEMTKDLTTGEVPTFKLISGYEQAKASVFLEAAIPNMNWVELGPKNNGGRTRALCVDLNDATRRTVFAGSVGGGLWKTTDITATAPNWTPVNDMFGNIAVNSIAQDPSNPQIIYFGTGEGYNNIDAIRGLGIWKSTDGGNTWAQLTATNNSNFHYCLKMVVNSSGTLFVSTSNGLYRSINGGASFTRVLGTVRSNDVEIAANGDVYASITGGVYKSTDGGATFGSALPIGIAASRIEIAVAASNANIVYALCESGSAVSGIVVSTDAGATFTTKTEPVDADGGIPATDFSRSQAWYDLTIEVNPANSSEIYVGGVDLFKSSTSGDTWQQIAHWYGGFGFQNVHADQHNIIFSPGSSTIAYFVNDGGVYRTANATATIPTITSKEINYNTSQFYACAMSPTAGTYDFLAGAQDNGTHKLNLNGIGNSVEVTGGDGMFCHIDQDQPQYWFSSYVGNSYYRSTNSGASFASIPGGNQNTGRFVNPTDYDDVGNILYCASTSNNFVKVINTTATPSMVTISLPALGGQISNIKVSPNRANRVFMSTGGGRILRVDDANLATPTTTQISTGLPAAYISSLEVETGNDEHLLVTFSNYSQNNIWETKDGGTTWASVEGNLPDMPVRWALFNPNNNDQAVIATELGVWSTDDLNGTSTVWGASNNGLANVRVDMLQVRQSDKLIIAATHGRGLYYSGVFAPVSADFNATTTVAYVDREVQFTNASNGATSSNWNFDDGTNSSLTNPRKKFTTPGTYNVNLSVNGGASNRTKQITILPKLGTPYILATGGDFETNPGHFANETINGTNWVRGNSAVVGKNGTRSGANAWVSGITGNYADNNESYLYGPNFNFAAAGTYQVSFYTKYVAENSYDGVIVEYSLDTGKVWTALGTTVQTNWYNFANTTAGAAFPTNQAFFTGNFGTAYAQKVYDVSFLGGNANVAFRLAFKSDGSVNEAGFAIDDFEVLGVPNGPLPITCIEFDALEKNNNALINWKIDGELNIKNYIVERSWNGINFEKIGTVLSKGNGNNVYSYTDYLSNLNKVIANKIYYRLQINEINGSSKKSEIDNINISRNKSWISVYPNPFTTFIQLNTVENIKQVQLLNAKGQIVYQNNNVVAKTLFMPQYLAQGSYVLKVFGNTDLYVEQLIKK